jgi:WD40 repeat protein/serine/threonine protein kinase
MAQHTPRVGQVLGNYRLLRLLGRGGFAEVYLAEHIHLETQTAIKVLPTQLNEAERSRFRQEARILARLDHPNIIPIHDFGFANGVAYLVMLYAPDGTMRQLYPAGSVLSANVMAKYISQAAAALGYAHDHRVIHRDVKPENMLLGPAGELMLSDFGIAIGPSTSTAGSYSFSNSTQDVAGTTAYMAPEQLQGKPQAASDQYALAVVAYEWLCGNRPFSGNLAEIAGQHLAAEPPPLRARNPRVAPEVEAVVLKALSKQPRARYPHVTEFAAALSAAAAASSNRPTPLPLPSSHIPPRRTRLLRPGDAETIRRPQQSFSTLPISTDNMATPPASRAARTHPTRTERVIPAVGTDGAPSAGTNVLRPQAAIPRPTLHRPLLGRRTLLLGLGGLLTTSAITGTLLWLETHQPASTTGHSKHPATPGAQHTPTTGTPNAPTTPQANSSPTAASNGLPPVGTTLYTYNATTFVNSVAWSPKGAYVASGNDDGVIQIWDLTTHDLVHTYTGHTARVNAVVWSPDETLVASASDDGTVQVWTPIKGTLITNYNNHIGAVNSISWSPDGMSIASGGEDATVQLWNPLNGQRFNVFKLHATPVLAVAWSPNGQQLASTATVEDVIITWNASNGFINGRHSVTSTVYTLAWSTDSLYMASGGNAKIVEVWDASSGQTIVTYRGHNDVIRSIAWSLDGQSIASSSDDSTVQIWKAYTGTPLYTYKGHSTWVFSVSWSHLDGKRIASGSYDKTVQIWQALA